MKNCRNCQHAAWYRSAKGRRDFRSRADCTAPVDTTNLPASAWEARRVLEKRRSVAEYGNVPVDCPQWQKIAPRSET